MFADEKTPDPSRRAFLAMAGTGLLATAGVGVSAEETVKDVGTARLPAPVEFPPWFADTERKGEGPPTALPPELRTGYAIVGLGRLSLEQILPAFAACKRSRPAALVSGDPTKARKVARQYGIGPEHLYSYETFDRLRDDADVQAIYIVLPNSMHLEFTERGASAGKHVLCEKPMATTVPDCERMIAACKGAGKMLMIAYRCQYEPHNRAFLSLMRQGELGAIRFISADNVQNMADPSQWRLKKALAGGGSLPDIGIYGLNAARFLTGEEPIEVFGQVASPANDPRFVEVEDKVAFQLRFPSGIFAQVQCGYSAHESRRLRVLGEAGWASLDPAFAYHGHRLLVGRAEGPADVISERRLEAKDQFALEIDHFSECLAAGKTPRTPGEEGLQDQRLMAAIYESAREGRIVKLPHVNGRDTTRGPEPS